MSVEFDQCVITRDGNNLLTSASAEHKIKFVKAYAVESALAALSNLTIQDLENNNAREGFIANVYVNNIAVPIVEEGGSSGEGGAESGVDGGSGDGGASGEGSIDGGGGRSRSLDGEESSGDGGEITISESENQATAVIIAGFKSSVDLANSTSRMFAQTIAITAKLDGNDDSTAVVFAVQVTNSSSVYLPGSTDVGAPNTNITFSVVVGSGEVSIIDIDEAQYSTLSQYLSIANRIVTTHAEGDSTAGEDQTIYGNKTFNGLVILGNDLIPVTDADYSIGRMADPEEGTDTRRLSSVNTYTLNTTELGSSDSNDTSPIYLFSGLEPVSTNTLSLGSSSKVFKDIYATNLHGTLDGTASYATTAGSSSTAESATKDGNGNVFSNKYVTLDTAQTITASKQFNYGITLYDSNLTLQEFGGTQMKNTLSCGQYSVTLSTYYSDTKVVDLNYYVYYNDGASVDSMQIYPSINNKLQLGTSGKKLKSVYATNFYGTLNGNASTATTASSATRATGDSNGNTIISNYAASLSTVSNTLRLKAKNGGTLGSDLYLAGIVAKCVCGEGYSQNSSYGSVGTVGLFMLGITGTNTGFKSPPQLVSGNYLRKVMFFKEDTVPSIDYIAESLSRWQCASVGIELEGSWKILCPFLDLYGQSVTSYYRANIVLAVRVY